MGVASNIAKKKLADGDLDLDTADIRSLLIDSSQAVDPDRDFVSQLSGELSGTGYVRKTLTSTAVTRDDPNNQVKLTADNRTWTGADFGTPQYEVFYVHVTNDADSFILGYALVRDSGNNAIVTNGADLVTTQHSTNGLIRLA